MTVNKSSAAAGAVVLVTVIPDSVCVLDTLTVTGAGAEKFPSPKIQMGPGPSGCRVAGSL